jgi:hypothetical protein
VLLLLLSCTVLLVAAAIALHHLLGKTHCISACS